MLIEEGKLTQRPSLSAFMGGEQVIYDLGNGYGLSLINSPMAHIYSFAWEAAVVSEPTAVGFKDLSYDTPLTQDVEVFSTEEEANAFIERALVWGKTGVWEPDEEDA